MNKKDIIAMLEDIATYMEIQGENTFKISAYRKAAQALERDERSLAEIDNPAALSGIGKGTAGVIQEYIDTGESSVLKELQAQVPEGLLPLLKLPGLGGKKIGRLYQELGVTSAEELEAACDHKEVQALSGFGAKSEEKILTALKEAGSRPERLPIAEMLPVAETVEQYLTEMDGITRWQRAGSLRRMEETVKDIDYIISTTDAATVREQLTSMPDIKEITADGETKVSLVLAKGYHIGVDFRLVTDEQFATTLHHFTGSKDHNVLMRQLAKGQDEKISEYGVENQATGDIQTFVDETAFYAHFGLHFIPPEARSGRDETEVFQSDYNVVAEADIVTDLHMHTTWSDGGFSIEEMVDAVRAKGYTHMAVTDHSKFLQVANGLNEERLRRQIEEVRRVNEEKQDIEVLAGTEMDIRPDGTLDFSDDLLKELDFVIASIHSAFSQTQEELHHRLEQALSNPHVHMIAHPTGRLIGARSGYDIDVEWLMKRAAETNTVLELNANPNRLDLNAYWLRQAEAAGVMIAVNTDAHKVDMLEHMSAGVGMARKALLKPEQIVNTWTYETLRRWLAKD
ncbi:DNA polymerase/3'-5' exonuclease PolX [Salsuginibacillus halophilus]|uniref:DNA polymerase/3'-5' exonuclease PolX n=1 Tax=Salsuginibacillus halophilus TaxID=517424 RepID=UPI000D0D61A6|nr:DNA polymerase/3'-5' exonuclease PolX [Salsuginibacillus halophilus]